MERFWTEHAVKLLSYPRILIYVSHLKTLLRVALSAPFARELGARQQRQ
jgi:hypothetical protein